MTKERIDENFDRFLKNNNYINIINCIFFYGRLLGFFDYKSSYMWICVVIFIIQIIVLSIGLGIRNRKLSNIKKIK